MDPGIRQIPFTSLNRRWPPQLLQLRSMPIEAMGGQDCTYASKEHACAALRASASCLGLAYDVLERIVFDPQLETLKNNAVRRHSIYQAMAAVLGVVRMAVWPAAGTPAQPQTHIFYL